MTKVGEIKLVKKGLTTRNVDTTSRALEIGILKKKKSAIQKQQSKRIWISSLLVFFLFFQQLASINTSPATKLDSSASDLMYGGFTSKEDFLIELESKTRPYPNDFLKKLGITMKSINEASLERTWQPSKDMLSYGPVVIWAASANYQPPYLRQNKPLEPRFAFNSQQLSIEETVYGIPFTYTAPEGKTLGQAIVGKSAQDIRP